MEKRPSGFILAISLWLWFTVIFANFAEAMAEGRGKAQAANLRKARQDTPAKKLMDGKRGKSSSHFRQRAPEGRRGAGGSRR